jgi:hypothetical protein
MKVCIQDNDGALIWSRTADPASGFTAENYLRDGTQQKIIAALIDALEQARGQLGGLSLQVVDAVPEAVGTSAKVNRHVPIAVAWNRDAGR